ncbi:single-stranded DNA-binding protein [Cytophaga hutchinsonii]|jgi:single-strand DNA-binding protein|uniref:Single-stranded DNA-binding protein n=1 Tax=Cytophaga hutchinsonii (strain ATCC 33406 / DSM 1761 / CIP 103989 / NBRC 15051 / NCIMB 9469 / D465) TaxID=269798 RepID=A0A6N4SWP3_CYTH3|nr:single-stranded DNA-binding protein [Cytophaga hutchinsonii]ABG60918.1 single-strand binding protein [Cytophaga hutchinsonii ATCC 33406]SFX42470.1 single-strand binding protein [Cytophaga hutchinsonii ATCC 33406]
MAGINKVILVGNLGKDPEVRAIGTDRKVANFSLATTESYKNKSGERVDQTEWHNVVFYGPVADVIERYLRKGSQIYVEGKIRTRSYDDKDGVKKYITEIIGDTMTMLGAKSGGSDSPNGNGNMSSSSSSASVAMESAGSFEPQTSGADDLPF